MVTLPFRPVVDPSSFVGSRVTVTGLFERLLIATPDCIDPAAPKAPAVSTYSRNAFPAATAGTPASDTVTPPAPPRRSENTDTPNGVPPLLDTRTDPVRMEDAAPDVATFRALLAGME